MDMTSLDARTELDLSAADWPEEARALGRLLAGRYSCRGYRSDPVPRAVIAQMLQLAQLSASWCNSQPWEVLVTEGAGTQRFREALRTCAEADFTNRPGAPRMEADLAFPGTYAGIYKERQREVGWQLYESVGVAYGDRVGSGVQMMKNFSLFDAPHALIVTSERALGIYGAIDCGLYVQALLLAAQSLGLGMIPQAALAAYAPLIRSHFGLPENRIVILGCSFGHADDTHPANGFRSRRAPPETAARWITD
jgi:nitroreductase